MYEPRYEIDLIPKAIQRAQEVQPDESVRAQWEADLYKDLENPSRTFSWFNWISQFVP